MAKQRWPGKHKPVLDYCYKSR